MSIVVCGSLATDHLLTFPGKFSDSLLPDRLHSVSVSFLADSLVVRRGGAGGNIAFGLGQLGGTPIMVGALGSDGAAYRQWLSDHRVDCTSVTLSSTELTARFTCTTDSTGAQIATFFPGAMGEARQINLRPLLAAMQVDAVIISPDDPAAMVRHAQACRDAGVKFLADPSQQLSSMDSDAVKESVRGAYGLFTNEYEYDLVLKRTGWTSADLRKSVPLVVTTLGESGVRVSSGGEEFTMAAVPAHAAVDPTGVGDAFRAGFLTGWGYELPLAWCAALGAGLATLVVESVGTQEYVAALPTLRTRIGDAYGPEVERGLAPVWAAMANPVSS